MTLTNTTTNTGSGLTLGVDSEIGALSEVIVHRPGLELDRLTPANIAGLLFDDVLWASRARAEHDAFVEALRDYDVTVHLFGDLLAQALSTAEGRSFALDRTITAERLGAGLAREVRALFDRARLRGVVALGAFCGLRLGHALPAYDVEARAAFEREFGGRARTSLGVNRARAQSRLGVGGRA